MKTKLERIWIWDKNVAKQLKETMPKCFHNFKTYSHEYMFDGSIYFTCKLNDYLDSKTKKQLYKEMNAWLKPFKYERTGGGASVGGRVYNFHCMPKMTKSNEWKFRNWWEVND